MKELIITADDFGMCPGINSGIREGIRNGAVSTVSAMVNFDNALPELNQLYRDHPEIPIGIHLNICCGKPVLDHQTVPSLVKHNSTFYTIHEILCRLQKISTEELRKELTAQIELFHTSEVILDHISCHYSILCLYPPFMEVVTQLALKYRVPVRNPVPICIMDRSIFGKSGARKAARRIAIRFGVKRPVQALKFLRYMSPEGMQEKLLSLKQAGVTYPDYFIDTFYGNPTPENLKFIFGNLPEGRSELMLHLGKNLNPEEIPEGMDRRYIPSREKELETITDPRIRRWIDESGIRITGFSCS